MDNYSEYTIHKTGPKIDELLDKMDKMEDITNDEIDAFMDLNIAQQGEDTGSITTP